MILDAWIAFNRDPVNLQYKDKELVFCNVFDVSLTRLTQVVKNNPKKQIELDKNTLTDSDFNTLLSILTRLGYQKALVDKLPVKSFEGLLNAIVNLMKQRQTESGRPSEIVGVHFEELKKKTPKERYELMMAYLRRPSN